jgi:hypothetical protein
MKRDEMLASYLGVLDEINASIRVALDTLNDNAFTVRMIVDELINGAAEAPFDPTFITRLEDFQRDDDIDEEDDIESLTDKIVEKIRDPKGKEGIRAVDIAIDTDKFNVSEVMGIVQQKLSGTYQKPEPPKKEEKDDDFDFKNPLDE